MLEDRAQLQDTSQDDETVLDEARERLKASVDAWHDNFRWAREDMEFREGRSQWPERVRKDREQKGRPCLTFNRMETFISQVVGDQRQNRPAVSVHPVDLALDQPPVPNLAGDNDYQMAQIYEGLIRNIEYQSRADTVYDNAFEQAVGNAIGHFRIVTTYADDDGFEQDIRIRHIRNPFSVLFDPAAEQYTKEDATYCFVGTWMPEKEFKKAFPDAETDRDLWEGLGDYRGNWFEGDRVRVAEYFRKVPQERKLVLLENGSVHDLGADKKEQEKILKGIKAQGGRIGRERIVRSHKVEWRIVNGAQVLKKAVEFPSRFIPIVPVYGPELVIDNEIIYRSLIRHSKDAQRNYNYWRSMTTELVALAPKAPWVGPAGAFEGYERLWQSANTENYAYLPFNDAAKIAPQRQPPGTIPTGALEEAQAAEQDMKGTIGIHSAGLGEPSNEKSGRAIMARQREGDVGTFAFVDNLARSIAHCGRILVDMIPRVYDTERQIRIVKPDGEDDFVKINVPAVDENGQPIKDEQGGQKKLYDLGAGKYDVTVKVGPSYTTQRQEAAEAMLQMVQGNPELWQVIGDLLVKNMDWPGAEEFAERLRKLIPKQLTLKEGEELPPEPPTPEQEAAALKSQADMAKAQAQMAKAEADTRQAEADSAGAEVDMAKVMQEMEQMRAMLAQSDEAVQERVAELIAQFLAESQ